MTKLLALVAVLAAPAAFAQWHPAGAPLQPPARQQAQGRWELRTVNHWVPATEQTVWVPGYCAPGHRHHQHRRCVPGYSERRVTPGYTQARQEWVWVAAPPYPHRPMHRPAVAVTFGLSAR